MESNSKVYLDGLNGIRAIAAMAVVISHITLHLADFKLNPYIFGRLADGSPRGLLLAGYGVNMFFALSGFLITYLLLLEKEKQNKYPFFLRAQGFKNLASLLSVYHYLPYSYVLCRLKS